MFIVDILFVRGVAWRADSFFGNLILYVMAR
jgi:hypothetical protein